jgi:hypothetical protein
MQTLISDATELREPANAELFAKLVSWGLVEALDYRDASVMVGVFTVGRVMGSPAPADQRFHLLRGLATRGRRLIIAQIRACSLYGVAVIAVVFGHTTDVVLEPGYVPQAFFKANARRSGPPQDRDIRLCGGTELDAARVLRRLFRR